MLAYLTRPEGMLLPAAIVLTLFLLPIMPATRINWPRWWRALAFLGAGFVLLAGPYFAIKGGLGTKPGIARVLGLAPKSDPMGLERERPLAAGQSTARTYWIAAGKMVEKGFTESVTPPLFAVGDPRRGAIAHSRSRSHPRPGSCCWSCWPSRPPGWCGCMPPADTSRCAMA